MGNTAEYDPSRIKEIAGIAPGSMSVQSQLIRLAWWMRERYGATMNQTLKTVLPVKEKIKPREKKTLHCLLNQEELEAAILAAQKRHYKARVRLLEAFRDNLDIPMEFARRELDLTLATIRPMEERGQLSVKVSREERGLNHVKLPRPAGQTVRLNEEQQAAVDRFCEDYETGKRETYLIHGVTGSGKTEVYMELMARVLRDGKQVILLIPEISLTYQTVMRFYRRFGDQIAILNSRLSAGERYDQWERAARGEVSVMIGPRSALFAPFSNLGLILIDEEHEGAYKSETMPRYHAREVAAERARLSGASLVLGSATPSLESYLRAQNGEYVLLPLHHRAVAGSILPKVQIADMRAEMQVGNKSVFSRTLDAMLTERLARGEQAMLFMNRRGYSNFVSCRSCGKAVTCPHCDVSLTHLLRHLAGDLAAVAAVDLIAVVFRGVVARRHADARIALQIARCKGEGRHRGKPRIDVRVDAVCRQNCRSLFRKYIGLDAAVVGNRHIRVAHMGVQIIRKALGGLAHNIDVHAVGARADHTAQARCTEI